MTAGPYSVFHKGGENFGLFIIKYCRAPNVLNAFSQKCPTSSWDVHGGFGNEKQESCTNHVKPL